MNLKYQKYKFKLKLAKSTHIKIYPPYILRSMLGMQLKNLCCIFKNLKTCEECPVNKKCAYSFIFESILDKDNKVFAGINRAPHPFILSADSYEGKMTDFIEFELTLIGDAISYFPYIFQAFLQAGKSGIFKERVKYEILDVVVQNDSILNENGDLNIASDSCNWNFVKNDDKAEIENISINLKSPFRLQKNNKVVSNFKYSDILKAAFRRVYELSAFYGKNSLIENNDKIDFDIYNKNKEIVKKTYYKNYSRYSARQDKIMRIGGIMGSYTIKGSFTKSELALLKAAKIVNIGKNTGFGFGNVTIIGH